QGIPVWLGKPSVGCRVGKPEIRLDEFARGKAVGEQARACPVEIDEIAVRCRDALAYERNTMMARNKRAVLRLQVSARKPQWHRAWRGVNLRGHDNELWAA